MGSVSEEFNCLPVENEEFRRISEKRALEASKPKRETAFIEKIPGKILQQRHALPGSQSAFVVSCFCYLFFFFFFFCPNPNQPMPFPFIIPQYPYLSQYPKLLLTYYNTIYSKQQPNHQKYEPKKTRQQECPKTSSWILSTTVSESTNTGHLEVSNLDYNSRKHISSRHWKWLHIWLSLVISP